MFPRPKSIAVSRSRGILIIDWEDDHRSEFPLTGLRASCPCAECMGGHANMGKAGSPDMLELPLVGKQSDELVDLKVVGNYALQLSWADGHNSGIYSWDYLRELCPCEEPPPMEGNS